MTGPFYPNSNAIPGSNLDQPGLTQPGDSGFAAGYTVPVSALTRGTFSASTSVSAITVKNVIVNATIQGLAIGTYVQTFPITTLAKQVWTISVPASTSVQAKFATSAPVVGLTSAHRGAIVGAMSAAAFPAAPEVYTGKTPANSSVVLETLALLPSLYNLDPEPAPAMTIGIATVTPPLLATSPAMNHINPTQAPIATKLENVTANLTTGVYQMAYTYWSSVGETALSPITSVALDIAKKQAIQVSGPPLPGNATEVRYYIKTPSATVFQLVASSTDNLPLTVSQAGETVNVRVDGTLLQITATGAEVPAFSCDLRDFTIRSLVFQIQKSGYLASAASGWEDFAATVLLDNFYGPDPQVQALGFTSVLWRIIRPIALCFDLWGDDLDLATQQLDVRLASGRWLDWWGILYGVPRSASETDDAYRLRITWEVMAPRCNNTAMEIILKEALGYDSVISDSKDMAQTWYTNLNGVGTPLRDAATGYYNNFGTVTHAPGLFMPGLSAWDAGVSYNATTFTWSGSDLTTLTWGQVKPAGTLIDEAVPAVTWPGRPGHFDVLIRQVVEDGQLGVAEIVDLLNRYKAAGFTFTLSVINHYNESYNTASVLVETRKESWNLVREQPAGVHFVTGTMASLTTSWPPQVAFEGSIREEWSNDGGQTWRLWGTDAVIARHPDPAGVLPLGLAATDNIILAAPAGIVLTD